MDLDRAIDILHSLRPDLEARGIEHAGIFGSIARGAGGLASDVDVLVTPSPLRHLDLFDLGGLQELLERGFTGVSADLAVLPIRAPALASEIDRERVDVF